MGVNLVWLGAIVYLSVHMMPETHDFTGVTTMEDDNSRREYVKLSMFIWNPAPTNQSLIGLLANRIRGNAS